MSASSSGSAADICKLAMIEVTAMLAKESPKSRLAAPTTPPTTLAWWFAVQAAGPDP